MAAMPGGQYVVLGAHQPGYIPLPAVMAPDGLVLTEWEPTAEELAAIIEGGRLRLWVSTFGRGFPPVALEVVQANGEVAENSR
jgi:hypothetical protein